MGPRQEQRSGRARSSPPRRRDRDPAEHALSSVRVQAVNATPRPGHGTAETPVAGTGTLQGTSGSSPGNGRQHQPSTPGVPSRGAPCESPALYPARQHLLLGALSRMVVAVVGPCHVRASVSRCGRDLLRPVTQPPCGSLSSRGNLGCRRRSNCGDGRAAGRRLRLVDPPLEESEEEAE
jgi:hypothetical protein